MKEKHRKVLEKFRKYGENYNPSINYNQKNLKLINYSRLSTTRPTSRQSKVHIHQEQKNCVFNKQPIVAITGASIAKGLRRYAGVWEEHFSPLSAINLGIGGDRTENVLWRINDVSLPSTVEFLVIHCGTNNLKDCQPSHIADGVLAIGVMAKTRNKDLKIIVTGLLHCDLDLPMRSNVAEVNKVLRRKCHKLKDFYFMEQDVDWLKKDSSLNMQFYYEDCIHLNKHGNAKFANSIIRNLKTITSPSSDIIMRIPSSEIFQVDRGHP